MPNSLISAEAGCSVNGSSKSNNSGKMCCVNDCSPSVSSHATSDVKSSRNEDKSNKSFVGSQIRPPHEAKKPCVTFAEDDMGTSHRRRRLVRTPTPHVKQRSASLGAADDVHEDIDPLFPASHSMWETCKLSDSCNWSINAAVVASSFLGFYSKENNLIYQSEAG